MVISVYTHACPKLGLEVSATTESASYTGRVADLELENLSPEECARLEVAEREALTLLRRKMSEGRWYPRRHMQLALFVVLPIFVGVCALAIWLVGP